MIMEGIRVLLLGMAGMFAVMGIIIAATKLLNNLSKNDKKEES